MFFPKVFLGKTVNFFKKFAGRPRVDRQSSTQDVPEIKNLYYWCTVGLHSTLMSCQTGVTGVLCMKKVFAEGEDYILFEWSRKETATAAVSVSISFETGALLTQLDT